VLRWAVDDSRSNRVQLRVIESGRQPAFSGPLSKR
jgi:hypothetical protein